MKIGRKMLTLAAMAALSVGAIFAQGTVSKPAKPSNQPWLRRWRRTIKPRRHSQAKRKSASMGIITRTTRNTLRTHPRRTLPPRSSPHAFPLKGGEFHSPPCAWLGDPAPQVKPDLKANACSGGP